MPQTPSKYQELILKAGGMNRVAGKTAPDPSTWFDSDGVVGNLRGQFTRMPGKVAQGNLGSPIMGFAQFWSPNGYMVGVQQAGYEDTPGEISAEPVYIPPGGTSIDQHYGYSGSEGSFYDDTYDDDITGSVTQVTPGQWFADYTGVSPDQSCVDQNLSGTIGPLVGQSPYSFTLNECVIVVACGLPGRGVKISSSDMIDTCYLQGAGWRSWNPSYRFELPTWHIVITGSSGVLVDTIVASATEPVLNLP